MTTPRPRPSAPTEDELLQQWAFLDRLVERQAAQLRAGVQDAEEPEDVVSATEVDSLRHELTRLRSIISELERDRDSLRQRLGTADRELGGVRRRLETLVRERGADQARQEGVIADLERRLVAAEAERLSAAAGLAEARRALSLLEQELDSLHHHGPPGGRGFWRLGRRPPGP